MGQAFLYGNGSGGSGGTLVVTAPAGVTCTITKDGKTKSKTVDQYGYATFKGLDTGTWTVVITDGSQTSPTRQVVVTADYDVTMSFFSATIAVTYPEGSTCTCSDGSTTLTAPDTSGSYTFNVPSAGEWTVSCTDGEDTTSDTVTITTDGESQSVYMTYWDGMLYDSGDECTEATGGWQARGVAVTSTGNSKTAPSLTKGSTSMTASLSKSGGSGNGGVVEIIKDVDLTNYNQLAVTFKNTSGIGYNVLGIVVYDRSISVLGTSHTDPFSYTMAALKVTDNSGQEIEYLLDIEAVNGNACVGIALYNAASSTTVKCEIAKVQLKR